MRIEKGHVAGNELDGPTTAADLGLGRTMSGKKDFIGRVMAERPALMDPSAPSSSSDCVRAMRASGCTPGAHAVGQQGVDALRNGNELRLPRVASGPSSQQFVLRNLRNLAYVRSTSGFSRPRGLLGVRLPSYGGSAADIRA